ncbi:MAG: TolC family protein [Pseudomonadota bacterium]|nr:TolC family protein [Pseudomonadota bacterium]
MFPLLTLLMTPLISLAVAAELTPSEAVRAALANDPELAARRADVEAATGLRRESGFLRYNPEVDLSVSTDGSRLTGSIVQPLSITGEGFSAARSARAGLDAAEAGAERARFETAAATRRAYARAVVAREQLRFAENDRELLARLRGIAEARLSAGEGIDLDLRLSRLEEARAMAAWLDAQAEASAADSDLSALIGMTPDELARDPLTAGPADSGAQSPRSDVVAAEAATRSARAALSRERAAVLPAVGLGAFYEADAGSTIFGPALTVQVPLWNRNQSGVGAARGNLGLAESVEASTAARAATEEARSAERLRVAEESLTTLAPDIDAEAAPALRAIEALFTSGEANLSDTLLLRSRVVEGQRAWIDARAAVAVARIDVALARQSESLLP